MICASCKSKICSSRRLLFSQRSRGLPRVTSLMPKSQQIITIARLGNFTSNRWTTRSNSAELWCRNGAHSSRVGLISRVLKCRWWSGQRLSFALPILIRESRRPRLYCRTLLVSWKSPPQCFKEKPRCWTLCLGSGKCRLLVSGLRFQAVRVGRNLTWSMCLTYLSWNLSRTTTMSISTCPVKPAFLTNPILCWLR